MRKLLAILFLFLSFSLLGQDDFTRTLIHGDSSNVIKTISDENGNIISVVGNTQIDTDNSKFGNGSILFDGNGDYFTISPKVFQLRDNDFTFDFQFNPNSIETSEPFFSKYDTTYPTSRSFRFFMTDVSGNNAKLAFYAINRVGSTPTVVAYYISTNTVTIADGNFHHIELTRNGSNIYIFFDGNSIPLTTITAIGNTVLDDIEGDFYIGYRSDLSYYLDGNIDEFRVSIKTARHTVDFTSPIEAYSIYAPEFNITDSLRAYWKFDESEGDATEEINNNTLINGNSVAYTSAGWINNAANFILADSNYFYLADSNQTELDITDKISFSFSYKPRSQPTDYWPYQPLINKWHNSDNRSWVVTYSNFDGIPFIYAATSKTGLTVDNNNYFYLDEIMLNNDEQYHIVVCINSTLNYAKFFINDTLRGTIQGDQIVDSIYNSTANIRVGTSIDGGIIDGVIDEMAIYNRVLYQADVDILWNNNIGLQYPFSSSGSNIKTYNGNVFSNIKTINGNVILNVKTLNTNLNR